MFSIMRWLISIVEEDGSIEGMAIPNHDSITA